MAEMVVDDGARSGAIVVYRTPRVDEAALLARTRPPYRATPVADAVLRVGRLPGTWLARQLVHA